MAATTTTTLKPPAALKQRLIALAEESGKSPHSLMVEAIERHIEYEEFVHSRKHQGSTVTLEQNG
jgi:predicted transcriptional regulator